MIPTQIRDRNQRARSRVVLVRAVRKTDSPEVGRLESVSDSTATDGVRAPADPSEQDWFPSKSRSCGKLFPSPIGTVDSDMGGRLDPQLHSVPPHREHPDAHITPNQQFFIATPRYDQHRVPP